MVRNIKFYEKGGFGSRRWVGIAAAIAAALSDVSESQVDRCPLILIALFGLCHTNCVEDPLAGPGHMQPSLVHLGVMWAQCGS